MNLAKSITSGALSAWTTSNGSHSASPTGKNIYDILRVSLSHLSNSWTLSSRSRYFDKELLALRSETESLEEESNVSDFTFKLARAFLESLPPDLPNPELDVSPQGDISFDWIREPKRALSAAISENGDVHYAWISGDESGHDSFAFTEFIDPALSRKVSEIFD